MSRVSLQGVTKAYGDFLAVNAVSLDFAEGEFVTLLGASGSGKTTCLRMVAGFIAPTAGRVFIGDRDVTRMPPYRRNTGMVFQQYALFPHLTVRENVAYGLKIRRLRRAEVAARTEEALRLVQMGHLGDRYPRQLSGGQKQRVALARAVVVKPQVLLLDEPLAALDLKLREELQVEIKRVQQAVGITTLFVTHDQSEALSLSDRVVVMRDGQVLQVDAPTTLYAQPNSRYVASFIGRMNFLEVMIEQRSADGSRYVARTQGSGGGGRFEVEGVQGAGFAVGEHCCLAFRPEDAVLSAAGANRLPMRVEKATYVGENWSLSGIGPQGEAIQINLPRGSQVPAPGEMVGFAWPAARSLLLKGD